MTPWVERVVSGMEDLRALNDPGHVYAICENCSGL